MSGIRRRRALVPALLLLLVAALGCSGESVRVASTNPTFVYVSPDPLGINPFLIMGETGIEAAAAKHGATALVLESEDPTSREENVRAAVDEGYSPIVVLGFEFNDILLDLAPVHPEVDFLVVDQCIEDAPKNVYCAVFEEYDAAFLLGAMAASLTASGHVGVVATADIPFLHRYTDGFAAGASHVDAGTEISVRWVGGENPFADPVRAKEQALDLAADGADLILAAAAAGNLGVFEAAREEGFQVFGIDVDQCPTAPGLVVDNLIKRVDLVIQQAIDAILAGEGEPMMVFGLDSGGLYVDALRTDHDSGGQPSQCLIYQHQELMQRIQDLADRITAGEIGIDDPMGLI